MTIRTPGMGHLRDRSRPADLGLDAAWLLGLAVPDRVAA